jgi:IclR helix-turn-helix domain
MLDPDRSGVSIKLSALQVDEVMRAVAQGGAPGIAALLADSLNVPADPAATDEFAAPSGLGTRAARHAADRRLSQSLLRGLSLLSCFGPERGDRGIVELASELGMSPSTAHRYAVTLVEIGLLERSPRSRKYRLPLA